MISVGIIAQAQLSFFPGRIMKVRTGSKSAAHTQSHPHLAFIELTANCLLHITLDRRKCHGTCPPPLTQQPNISPSSHHSSYKALSKSPSPTGLSPQYGSRYPRWASCLFFLLTVKTSYKASPQQSFQMLYTMDNCRRKANLLALLPALRNGQITPIVFSLKWDLGRICSLVLVVHRENKYELFDKKCFHSIVSPSSAWLMGV